MNDDFSTQLPSPPELRPLTSGQSRVGQVFSSILILAGLVLFGAGGCMYYQHHLEALKPPPARILEVSAVDSTGTAAPQPSPTRPDPTLTATPSVVQIAADRLSTTPAETPFTSTPLPVPPTDTPSVQVATDTPMPPPISTPTDAPVLESAAAQEEIQSLADNPLVVQEEMPSPATAEAAPASSPASSFALATSPPTRIVAGTIGLDAPVIEVGWEQVTLNGLTSNVWTVADYAAGWHKNSTLPGQGGNVVLSGHHNIKGEVFRYTVELNVGDPITLYVGDQAYEYVVADKFIVKDKGEPDAVRRENARWIGPFNEERLTLVTCWPYTNNTHRAIVIARPASAAP